MRIRYAVVSSLLFLSAFAPLNARALVSSSSIGLLIPLYTEPGSSWSEIESAKATYPSVNFIVVINPNDGPGASYSSTWASAITQMQNAGVTVIGYTPTFYGAASLSSVESQIQTYSTWYKVNGVFLDNMAENPGYETYYSMLTTYAKSLGQTYVVGNPGTTGATSYVGTVDTMLVYEDPGLPPSTVVSSAYPGYSSTNFATVGYAIPEPSQAYIDTMSSSAHLLYFTDASGNPYDTLPSYFLNEVAMLAAAAGDPSVVVQTQNLAGAPILGYRTDLLNQQGSLLADGYSSTTYPIQIGTTYGVEAESWGNCTFSKWSDGVTNNPRYFTASNALTTYTGIYNCLTSAYIKTIDQNGNPITGYRTVLYSSSYVVLAQSYSPNSFTVSIGVNYYLRAESYGSCTFNHWMDGVTSQYHVYTGGSSPSTYTAIYNC